MRVIVCLLFFLSIMGCQSNSENTDKKQKVLKESKSSPRIIPSEKMKEKRAKTKKNIRKGAQASPAKTNGLADLIIDEETDYSKEFVRKVRSAIGMEKVILNEGMMILNQKDTIQFPDIPKLHREIKFTGMKDDLAIALTVNRKNLTSIDYRLEIVEFGKSNSTTQGTADLAPFFFLRSETDTDDLTGTSYLSTTYSSREDSCSTSIRIGNADGSIDKPMLAKIVKNCNDELPDLTLDNFPVLREK